MNMRNRTVTALILSSSLGFGTQAVLAQTVPGGAPSGPMAPGGTGPVAPQPDPNFPRQMQPTIPGQPAPSLPGQSEPIPGQQGTIPERMQPPDAGGQRDRTANVSPDDIRKAQEALTANGHNLGMANGVMDSKTQQALRDFQKANKLPVTGVLDPQTAQKLGITLRSKPGSNAQPGQDNTMPRTKRAPSDGNDTMK
jgi:hypothetical protein